ncbi:MAG: DUF2752 domain-containing protein [Verrucomicrobiales bacterium]|jgi:hypothetical protein|nr:DUF2752 domain-containing protein [Verrucomicrobiales bacterium]HQZ27305.1 DUF2752 domain-containing protein [Verrucomicrobiales bacterium]
MKTETPVRKRRPEVLVAPVITCLAVFLMLFVARIYDRLPARLPSCRFQATFGIPCLSCGGTRAMKAFVRGDLVEAVRFNPAAILGVAASCLWLLSGITRFFLACPAPSAETTSRRIKFGAILTLAILALNWIYLILFLP